MENGELVFDPQAVADMRADSWMKEWTAPNDNRDNVRLQVEELRALALNQPVIRCHLTELDKAFYTFILSTMLLLWGLIASVRASSKLFHTRAG